MGVIFLHRSIRLLNMMKNISKGHSFHRTPKKPSSLVVFPLMPKWNGTMDGLKKIEKTGVIQNSKKSVLYKE